MNDTKNHKHGDEGDFGTHYACNARLELLGDKATCCGCEGHECDDSALLEEKK